MSTSDADRRLARIAAIQHQRFTRGQAVHVGYSVDAIRHKLETGRWKKESSRVFALASAPSTWDGRLIAALLACPHGAASHLTAAYLHASAKQPPIIDIALVPGRRAPRLPGVRIHRPAALDAITLAGYRVTTIERTIVDLAPTPHLVPVLDAAIDRRRTTLPRLKSYVASLKTNRGLRELKMLIEDRERGRLTTELERRFDELLKHSSLPCPARQHPIGSRFADFAYVEERIVIELDGGGSHMRKEVFEEDRTRQNEIVLAGWLVLRFTWDDVTKRPEVVVQTIARMLALTDVRGGRP